MRIAVAGFMHESNTFNPLRTDRAAFAAQCLALGPDWLPEWRACALKPQYARSSGYCALCSSVFA